jgi:hypothetical protein
MVTYNSAGRFGNVFMECATAISYALKHGLDFTTPKPNNNDRYWNPFYFEHLYNPNWNPNKETIRLWENGHEYQELPFEESWRDKNIIIEGYRQSEKYFKEHRAEILSLLEIPFIFKHGVVSIHVRRGDYLHLQMKHILYSIDYMTKAMGYFYNLEHGYDTFKVFSDDIPWCREEFAKPEFSKYNISFSTNQTELEDIAEMASCEHNINSSSTFAWAAAWLNRNQDKIVVTPEKWFQDGWMGLNTKDIIPENWVKL